MNFLIIDNELSSLNLINQLLAEFHFVKLMTSNETSTTITSSSFLSINHGDINNASQVIENLSVHENDPLDAILIFNLSLYSSLNNIMQTMRRLRRKAPRLFLFLFLIDQQDEIDQNINKLLKESSQFIQWTIVICPEIDSSTAAKYRVEIKSDPTNQQSIGGSALRDFICDELSMKKYLNDIIYLY